MQHDIDGILLTLGHPIGRERITGIALFLA